MSKVGKKERVTQNRVIRLFDRNAELPPCEGDDPIPDTDLGYTYLGNWEERESNDNIEEALLSDYLEKSGYTQEQITKAIYHLRTEATNHNRSLYDNNKAVYHLIRYGAQVKVDASEHTETVKFINWQEAGANDFYVAEEVTLLAGNHERRPDVVLYVNGIAIGVIELKNSRVSIGDGIRQQLSNQQKEFNEWFFTTVQFLFAGNDTEGLKYGTIRTPEKYYLRWKEDEDDSSGYRIDKYLRKICSKERLIELIHDFVLFDAGVKKLPRVHQYFGVKKAQPYVNEQRGGIIWHTQGSGKSLVMVLLAKWILENKPNARVAIVTDRDELDKQIKDVFSDAGEAIYRTTSGKDLLAQLGKATPRLLCSLVQKFGRHDVENFENYIRELEAKASPTVGDVFVFVDECHRTQSGRLHRTMKAMMPDAVFIGFTGTPLLKKDKKSSLEVFGGYIHTYRFAEAVEDEVVVDLIYEARDIEQHLGSKTKIDQWFEAKTRGLNDWQRDELRKKWGTMQNVLSSSSRMDRVVEDIVFDFNTKPRLSSQRGTAMLVAGSIYEACRYYELFQKTELKGKCAVVTSYNPQTKDTSLEETGANTETDRQYIYNLYAEILKDVEALPNLTKTETYEAQAKKLFIEQPANMKLLIVVDKLLTGFSAPSCTYLYIDKSMQDHGLFQAICRTNRLDGEDKEFGYVVDYRDLFKKVEKAIAVYSSELAAEEGDDTDPQILLRERLEKGRERLETAREALKLLCEPVDSPKGELEYIHYFCGNTEKPAELQERESQRVALYKATVALLRAYAAISDELEGAGYSADDVRQIDEEVKKSVDLREIIRKASGETIDLKPYEADMRRLIDMYIKADEARPISDFKEVPLLDLIIKSGIADAINSLPAGVRRNKDAVAETISNNVRSTIIKSRVNDPAYYDKMSALLGEIIDDLKAKRLSYAEYLEKIRTLAEKVKKGHEDSLPTTLNTPGRRALYNNLGQNEELALAIDSAVKYAARDAWRGMQAREREVKYAVYQVVKDEEQVEQIFPIIKQHKEY
ncbi:MAG: HsdR family type I site-specific deoxyribonuclease [Deltaproteobacteria bacterium]|nr:HsdR family type I site-specific deoxyribonuclease [Deltaproteobacteria bacterium]